MHNNINPFDNDPSLLWRLTTPPDDAPGKMSKTATTIIWGMLAVCVLAMIGVTIYILTD